MSCALKCVEEEDLKARPRSQKRNGGAKERVFPRLQRVCTFYMLMAGKKQTPCRDERS